MLAKFNFKYLWTIDSNWYWYTNKFIIKLTEIKNKFASEYGQGQFDAIYTQKAEQFSEHVYILSIYTCI